MGNIDLTALEIFKTVAEQGGITKAALRLHRVQSNVTTRVKQLEERLGAQLFLRQHRRLVLSPQGKRLLAYADRLLHLSSEAEAALRNGTPAGALQIGALESTAATRLPPILSRYHRAYPDVRIELVTGTTGALVAKVMNHEVEAAFVAEPFTAHDLEAEPVFSEDLVLIAPRSFPKIKTPKDIDWVLLPAAAGGVARRREGGAGASDGVRLVPRHRRLRRLWRGDRDRPALGASCLAGGARRHSISLAHGRREGTYVLCLASGPSVDCARRAASGASEKPAEHLTRRQRLLETQGLR
jgi:DNA-binding transcriptional LysR family regulator